MAGGPFSGIIGGILGGDEANLGTGILGNMNTAMTQNAGTLLGLGAGLMSGDWGMAAQGAMSGMQQDQRTRLIKQKQAEEEQRKVEARKLAQDLKLPPSLASDPDTVFALAQDAYKYRAPEKQSLEQQIWSGLSDEQKQQYVQNNYLTPKNARQAPSGYEFNPDGTLRAIAGGPQDPNRPINEPLPAELGARFGLANQYYKRFDGIEADLTSKDPKSVGPIDGLGFGESGALQRDMKLGSEAMTRMLTGAGMSQGEAENEVKQYLPALGDSAATVLDKQKRLRAALRDMQREALKGRRSEKQIEEEYPAFPVEKFGSAKSAVQGKTKSGVSWSAQ